MLGFDEAPDLSFLVKSVLSENVKATVYKDQMFYYFHES